MNAEQMFDRYVAHGVTAQEIAAMKTADIATQIAEMDEELDAAEAKGIAVAISDYAKRQ